MGQVQSHIESEAFGKMRGKLELRFLQNEEGCLDFFVCLFVAFCF